MPFSTIPAPVVAELGLAMMEGARKYGRHNYRVSGVRASVYFDAAMRHLFAWWEGQDIDPASGIHHLAKAMACFAVVRDSEMQGNWVDDRPPRTPNQSWIDDLNVRAKEIIEKHPTAVPAFTQRGLDVQPELAPAAPPQPTRRSPDLGTLLRDSLPEAFRGPAY